MRFQFIEAHAARYPVCRLCRVLEVSPSGFYAWRGRPDSPRSLADRRLTLAIRILHEQNRQVYGAPRLQRELKAHGQSVGRKRVARLMRAAGLRARSVRKFKATPHSNHGLPVAPNVLNRRFTADAPNRAWVADISDITTGEGWLYLAVVMDLYSRPIVGWSMDERITEVFAMRALRMALQRRRPAPGLVHHSDSKNILASCSWAA